MIKQLTLMAIAAGLLAVASVQQSYAQYGDNNGGSAGTATTEQLARCDQLKISRNQCTDNTILAAERVQAATETTYGNDPDGSGTPYFRGVETFAVIGILGAVFGSVAGAFYVMGKRTKQVPA
jgi:hypothetical protein